MWIGISQGRNRLRLNSTAPDRDHCAQAYLHEYNRERFDAEVEDGIQIPTGVVDEARECDEKQTGVSFLRLGPPFGHSFLCSLTLPFHPRYLIHDSVSHVLRARILHRSGI